jgi:hypothetical protein
MVDLQSRKASFVVDESVKTEKFKYLFSHCKGGYNIFVSKILYLYNFIVDKLKKYYLYINWNILFKDVAVWFVEVFVEGLTANFATHFLFGVDFNIFIIFAHGIFIHQSLSIIDRLKVLNHGPDSKIPPKEYSSE